MVKTAPFVHSGITTDWKMLDVMVALAPASVGAVWYHGWAGLLVLAVAVATCLTAGWMVTRDGIHMADGVTGLLYGLMLPAGFPIFTVILGGFIGVLGGKYLFGGLGKNWLNPAATAVAFLLPLLSAVPLSQVAGTLVLGYTGGAMGETSSLLLVVGGAYLAVRRLLSWEIVGSYLAFACLTAGAMGNCNPQAVLAWGGTALAALFLTADPVTSPMGRGLRTVYGAGCGILATWIAYHISAMAGVCLGILIMNVLTRITEKIVAKSW